MGSMDKEGRKAKGFTVLELVVAIFLIAIVIGTVLLIMSANLNIIDKANDILVANALAQYTI
ncbi:MAG: type II secretion system GspH family protein, partial [Candidatus Omnitrophica bacterium]|nr:type II secretion system GspH family protein [Candidatus Omnitrophota bacterium]